MIGSIEISLVMKHIFFQPCCTYRSFCQCIKVGFLVILVNVWSKHMFASGHLWIC